jgi:hypothetical protein
LLGAKVNWRARRRKLDIMKAALNARKRDRFLGRPGGVDRGSTRHLSQAPARQLAGHSGAAILAISRDGAGDGDGVFAVVAIAGQA